MRDANRRRKGLVGVKVLRSPRFGSVSSDQVTQTAQEPEDATILSEMLTSIRCKREGCDNKETLRREKKFNEIQTRPKEVRKQSG